MILISYKKLSIFIAVLLISSFYCFQLWAIPVFPGAVGFGTETRAAYGNSKVPLIFIVTNLSDDSGTPKDGLRNGIPVKTGSFVQAVKYDVDNKLIIFEVSGTIKYNGRLTVKNNYVTIAGQTAPSPGITLRNCTLQLCGHDILVQHIRVRVGDEEGGLDPGLRDGINPGSYSTYNPYNVVVDHCSVSWAMDENMGIGKLDWETNPNINVTVSNCIIAEPLDEYKPGHLGKNLIVGPGKQISIIGNLLAHSKDRNPYIAYGDNTVIIANNLVYNPGYFNMIFQIARGPTGISAVGNVVRGGPNSGTSARKYIPTFWKDMSEGSKIYLEDNKTDLGTQKSDDDWSLIRLAISELTLDQFMVNYKSENPPIWLENFNPIPSSSVQDNVLNSAGARPKDRDAVDDRIVNDVIHGSGRIIISQNDVGGWPVLEENQITHVLPDNPHGDLDNDGYTNLEEWLHKMAQDVESSVSSPMALQIVR